MFGLTGLVNAVQRLTAALTGLAETAETVNTATRERLGLDDKQEPVVVEQIETAAKKQKAK